MGKTIKNTFAGILLLTMSLTTATTAFAGGAGTGEGKGDQGSSSAISYNVGFMTAYWYRGAFQNDSAINFGADYEAGNFYLGT